MEPPAAARGSQAVRGVRLNGAVALGPGQGGASAIGNLEAALSGALDVAGGLELVERRGRGAHPLPRQRGDLRGRRSRFSALVERAQNAQDLVSGV